MERVVNKEGSLVMARSMIELVVQVGVSGQCKQFRKV